ncbi:MAG: DUF1624 domain-containing protein [Thermoplasmatales archaeon]|nr:MAG: DUF1624 domain-containing protein [Thermoplasmatales archaeon]
MKSGYKERFWEIDFIRGIAIIMVIFFHILIDLNFFDIYKINVFSGVMLPIAYTVATTFLFLVGISLTLKFSKIKNTLSKKEGQLKIILRGLKVFGIGLVITLSTLLYLDNGFIIFGVLHCIGISIILSIPFLTFRVQNLVLGSIFIFLGLILKSFTFDFYWLAWLGFKPTAFYTVDYYPLLPWFGVVLIGIFLGNNLYPDGKRRYAVKDLSTVKTLSFFCYIGRHTLIIYLVHQPIIVGIIHILFL